MEVFDNELNHHQDDMDKCNTCLECEKQIEIEKDFCSEMCYKINQY